MKRYLALLVCGFLLGWPLSASAADWFDDDWAFRMPIALDSAQVEAGLNEFPVLINTTDEDGFVRDNLAAGVALEEGGDIVFTAGDGTTVLPHEIEFFDPDTGVLVAWVRVDELDADEDSELFVYYGNENAGDRQQVEAVWANNFRMVQHLQEEGGRNTDLFDSTTEGNDGDVIGTGGNHPEFIEDGIMDGARFMTGNQQGGGGGGSDQPHVRVPHSASLAPTERLTAEAWARADSDLGDGVNHHPIMFKGERIGWGANYLFRIAVRDGSEMTWGVTCGNTEAWFHAGSPRFGEWAHYAITFDGTTTRAYINGQEVGSSTACSGRSLNPFSDQPLRSGWTPRRQFDTNDQSFYRGGVDELRISAVSRSQPWLATQFNNQSAPAGFHAFSAQQQRLALQDLMIAYWFDQDWAETGDDIPDRSGEGRTGESNGAGFVPAGSESARSGSPGTCGYADIPSDANVTTAVDEEINEAHSFTTSFWARTTEADQNNAAPSLLAGGELESFFAERFEVLADFQFGRRDLVFFVRQDGGPDPERVLRWTPSEGAGNDPFSGNWVHITARHDMNERQLRLYANGSLVAEENYGQGGPGRLAEATGPLQIGGFSDGTAPAALETDEFRFLGRPASDDEVDNLFLEERDCPSQLDRFEIEVPETASVCVPAPVTLTALDENGNVLTNYAGTADLTTSSNRGNWALEEAQGILEPDPHEANDGAASYTFVEADEGSASLTLANESADRLTITATDADGGQSGTSAPIQFQENAFVISVTDALGEDFVAGRDHDVQVEAVQRDPENGECGLITDYDGNVDLKGWIERSEDDPGGEAPSLSDAAGNDTMPDAEPTGNNTTLAFEQGAATVEWLTTDVGQYALNLKDDSSGIVVDEEDNPIPVIGAGQNWTVRPFGFDVSVTGNPGAENATGPAFMAAGRPFEVNVRAVAWQPADDGNEDGQPDGHDSPDPENLADLSDNPTTSAFGNTEDLSVAVTSDLVAGPDNADDPELQGAATINDFTDGEAIAEVSYSEVGSISLLADLGDFYLGRAVTVTGRSGYVGRFHPERFTADVDEGSFAPECDEFAYIGQPHGYELEPHLLITPRNLDGVLLSNYRDSWQRLEAGDVERNFPGEDGDNALEVDVTDVTGMLEPEGDGRMTYRFGSDEYSYLKTQDAQLEPFTSDLTINVPEIDDGDAQLDSDQSPLSVTPAGIELRYGRIQLSNVFGPEDVELAMGIRAEFWNGDRFTLNQQESGALNGAEEAGCFFYNPANTDDGGDVTVELPDVAENLSESQKYGLFMGEAESGNEIILRSARDPVDPDDRQSRITLDVPDWLKVFDEDGELRNPEATATFGVYRGHDRIIHWREVR